MKTVSIVMFLLFRIAVVAQDCLPQSLRKKVLNKKKYNLTTVKGETYQMARLRLSIEIPKAGFLQQIKLKKTSVLSNNKFSQKLEQHMSLRANVETFKEYACKKNGEFFVTAIWAKDGVSYVDMLVPKELTMKNVKKWCGDRQVTILASDDRSISYKAESVWKLDLTSKENHQTNYYYWYVLCGKAKAKIGKHTIDNIFQTFLFFRKKYNSIEDKSLDMWLHLNQGI